MMTDILECLYLLRYAIFISIVCILIIFAIIKNVISILNQKFEFDNRCEDLSDDVQITKNKEDK